MRLLMATQVGPLGQFVPPPPLRSKMGLGQLCELCHVPHTPGFLFCNLYTQGYSQYKDLLKGLKGCSPTHTPSSLHLLTSWSRVPSSVLCIVSWGRTRVSPHRGGLHAQLRSGWKQALWVSGVKDRPGRRRQCRVYHGIWTQASDLGANSPKKNSSLLNVLCFRILKNRNMKRGWPVTADQQCEAQDKCQWSCSLYLAMLPTGIQKRVGVLPHQSNQPKLTPNHF